MSELIRSKVARILNSREIAIAAGSQQGIEVGMLFDVLDQNDEDIVDPDTGNILGSLERPKVRVKITQVQERLSVASTYKKKRVNIGGDGFVNIGMLSKSLMPPEYVTKYETLKTDEKTWEDLDEKESFVKTGDPVVQVIEDLEQ
ncbi:MAG: hypothetical protein AB7F25_06425 [Deferribacterales bacterium]